jgi:hypothetical protein
VSEGATSDLCPVRAYKEEKRNMSTGKEKRKPIKGKINKVKLEKREDENGRRGDVGERKEERKESNK